MSKRPITVEELRGLINTGEAKDPLVFLEAVMNGQDPRRLSDIHKLILEIEDFSDGVPSEEDWSEVVNLIIDRYKYYTVSMGESTNAAKTLAEYLHAKRKNVEISGGAGSAFVTGNPLTEDEIEMFKEKFNDDF